MVQRNDRYSARMSLASQIQMAAKQTDRNPSDAQKASGNYAKGKVHLSGLEIAIENPKGATRRGVDKGGKEWRVTMPAHYGYVKGTEGKDGDHVDCYIGPKPDSSTVWVVDQVDAGNKKFDEHKCLLGYTSQDDALADYKRAFSDGKGADRIGSVTAMSMTDFKDWLRNGNTKAPMSKAPKSYASGGAIRATDPTDIAIDDHFRQLRAHNKYLSDLYDRDAIMPSTPLMAPDENWSGLQVYSPKEMYDIMERQLSKPRTGTRNAYAEGGPPKSRVPMPMEFWTDPNIPEFGPAGDSTSDPQWPAFDLAKGLGAASEGLPMMKGMTGGPDHAVMGAVKHVAQQYGWPAVAGLLGLGTGLGASTPAGSEEAEKWNPETAKAPYGGAKRNSIETKGIQERAAAKGLYPTDKIDGIDSGGTRAAEWELIKQERKEAAAQKLLETKAETEAETARTNAAKQKADQEQAGRDAEERKDGLGKFEAAKNDPTNSSWLTPNVGYGLGIGVGGLLGLGTSAIFDRRARALVQGANELLSNVGLKGKAAGTVSERISKVNDFARKGGAGEQVPFTRAPTQDPPWKPNTKAMEASSLYPPRSMAPEYMTQGALAASGLTESGVSAWMAHGANERLKQAEEAVNKSPNATTIAAYLNARNSAQMWESLENVGRTWALTQGTAAKLGPMVFGGNRRPDIAKYEGELGSVSSKLRKDKLKAKAYDEKAAAEKAAKELQKAERAAKRAAKKPNGVGPAATGLIGGSQLLADPLGEADTAVPTYQDETLPTSEHNNGGVVKHHSHFQPRDRKTGRYAGGPVFPDVDRTRAERSQGGTAVSNSARQYADGGTTGKSGRYPYHAPDYGNDLVHPTELVFSQRRAEGGRTESVEAPQPDFNYPYGRPRFPNPDPRAYFDADTQKAWASEGLGPRMKESGLAALPWAMMTLGPRDRAMGKMGEATAGRAFDEALFNSALGKRSNEVYDPGITGGRPQGGYDRLRSSADSSSGLSERPGVVHEWNPTNFPYRDYPSKVLRKDQPLPTQPANDYRRWGLIEGGARAAGGAVTGGIVGNDSGRGDTRNVEVESGSFVIPANEVAFLGEGNNGYGQKVLDGVFGMRGARERRAGGSTGSPNVPIRISDGEYVLSPEQVARVGGGDVKKGHALLDQMVMQLRKQHQKQLATLPAPAKD